MRFAQACTGDTDKAGALVECIYISCTGISHRGAQAANQLMQDIAQRPFVGNTAFNAFGYQFHGFIYITLEVPVLAALLHGTNRAHAAIGFIGASLIQNLGAGGFFGTGEHRAEHAGGCACSHGLGKITGKLDATIGDDRNAGIMSCRSALHHGGELWHADSGHNARGADRARTDAYLDSISAGIGQIAHSICRSDIAANDLYLVAILLFDFTHLIDDRL